MKNIILGIGGYTVDSSATLLIDGELIGSVNEERFTRKKHQGGWPEHSIRYLIKLESLKLTDIDYVTFTYDPEIRLKKRLSYYFKNFFYNPYFILKYMLYEWNFVRKFKKKLFNFSNSSNSKIIYVKHHDAHAASAYYMSGFSKTAYYTLDWRGEWETTTSGTYVNSKLNQLNSSEYPNSLGLFYNALTTYLGFGSNDEYKVMGLSSYGTPKFVDDFLKIISVKNGKLLINKEYIDEFRYPFLKKKFYQKFGPSRKPDSKISKHYINIASSVQKIFENCALSQINYLQKATKLKKLVIAGGCALNGLMIGKIIEKTNFKEVFVPPAPGDDGLSLGSAFYVNQIINKKKKNLNKSASLGTSYSNESIQRILEETNLKFIYSKNITKDTARLIKNGKVLGWFQGRMELGPRALGNRSILASPLIKDMKERINKKIKFRENFRPFAPAVIEEQTNKFFVYDGKSPFMNIVRPVREKYKNKLPAITHIDGTARIQTVNKKHSRLFWELINEFGKLTKFPVLLNTSFNIMGEPIVENPSQAINCFKKTDLDYLIIGNFVVRNDKKK